MRRNVLISSRFCVQSLFYNQKMTNNFLTKCFCHNSVCDENKIPKTSFVPSRFYTQSNGINCWSCHKPINISIDGTKESFFCSSCGSLQEAHINYNYFSLFGIREHFGVNQNELTKRFRDFQSVLHPDKFSNKNETEQNLSAAVSSLVNKAYKTLYTPIKRAEYILELKGITIPEDNNAVDKEFLLEIMERNEEVDDAENSVDLKTLLKRLNDDKEKAFSDFELHLKSNDLNAAKSSLILLRYYSSLETSIKNKLSKLGVVE